MPYTKLFSELSKNNADIAGGKGASLGEMLNAGIPVPDGFVVLSTTFDEFIKETELEVDIEGILDQVDHKAVHTVDEASAKIQEIISNAKMPKPIADAVVASFNTLGSEFVAVRSSATAEDGAEHAWAGQLESYLNTTKEDLLEKVQKCWASLFTPRAIFYRFEKGLHQTHISVAVVVQKMVNSEKSGIAFSVHPVTEDQNQLIIEAGLGLGEAIVSGSVTPDSYVVEKDSRHIIECVANHQNRALYRKVGGGNEWKDLDTEEAEQRVLSEKEILELSEIIITVENNYGFPCDIEWAFENGKFYIVQSRPITTLKNTALPNTKNEDLVMLSKWCSREYSLLQIVQYCQLILENKEKTGYHMDHELFFYNSKIKMIEVWHSLPEMDGLFKSISVLARDPAFVKEAITDFNQALNELIPYFEGSKKTENISEFTDLYNLFFRFYRGNSYVWILPLLDFLSEIDRKAAMDCREATEKYSSARDAVLVNNLKILFPSFGDLVKFLLPEEVFSKVDNSALLEELKKRSLGFIYYRDQLYPSGELENFFHSHGLLMEQYDMGDNPNEIQGAIAQKGLARGRVALVFTAADLDKVKEGDILVSPMTRPEFLPTMQRALAFVTDEGGITCHAAIVARELNKPCIIGTKFATQVLQDGDEVEVDADKGIVRIIQ